MARGVSKWEIGRQPTRQKREVVEANDDESAGDKEWWFTAKKNEKTTVEKDEFMEQMWDEE